MSTRARTRYFLIGSLLLLTVGLGVGLVAYYAGPIGALAPRGGPDELQLIPRSAAVVAFADVHEIMRSDLHQRTRQPNTGSEQELQAQTGINLETDVDHVVTGMIPAAPQQDQPGSPSSLVLARGRFDETKIAGVLVSRGARAETYRGARMYVMDGPAHSGSWTLAFVEPGLIGFGSTPAVRMSIDLENGGESVKTNGELMNLVRSFDDGNAWAIGRFDTVAQGRVPDRLSSQLPPITWLSVGGHIDSGIRGIVRADTKDADSANNLREAARGFLALARLQMSAQPEMRQLVDSLNLGGTGTAVTLSFDVPPDAVGALKSYQPQLPLPGK